MRFKVLARPWQKIASTGDRSRGPSVIITLDLRPCSLTGWIAPYKFSGGSCSDIAWFSPRAAVIPKRRLAAKQLAIWGLGSILPAQFTVIRKIIDNVTWIGDQAAGGYLSRDEPESGVSAIASPLFADDSGEAVDSLAVIVPAQRLESVNLDRLTESVREAAARTSQLTRAIVESRRIEA